MLVAICIIQFHVCMASLAVFNEVFSEHDRVRVCSDVGIGLSSIRQGELCECGIGFEPGAQSCQACSINHFKNEIANVPCTECGNNKATLPGVGDGDLCLCFPGFSADSAGVCTSCASNTYKAHYGNNACLPCYANSVSLAESISINNCQCDVGYTVDVTAEDFDLKCVQCEIGRAVARLTGFVTGRRFESPRLAKYAVPSVYAARGSCHTNTLCVACASCADCCL